MPEDWVGAYPASAKLPLNAWVADFAQRLQQLQSLGDDPVAAVCGTAAADGKQVPLWLGGMSAPAAFLTATRQHVAQKFGLALEDLELVVSVGEEGASTGSADNSFVVEGLALEGAGWDAAKGCLAPADATHTLLAPTRFAWMQHNDVPPVPAALTRVTVPVYANDARRALLFTMTLPAPDSVPTAVWQQRAVCCLAWTPRA